MLKRIIVLLAAADVLADVPNMHSTFVVGEPMIDSTKERLAVVLATENLLLNMYRATTFDLPLQVQMDTTHCLVIEGHAVMPIGVTSLDQCYHQVALAIVDREDAAAHAHCIRQVKAGVEATVKKYLNAGIPV